ncbi:MAG: TRAP transporter large permease [Kofleriaceae bacterium]
MKTIASILALALLGSPLFVIIGVATAIAFVSYGGVDSFYGLGEWVLDPFQRLIDMESFLAIPLFVGAGALMTEGGMARRLIDFTRALVGWMPGGEGISAVIACMGFAAISGSSPVTLIAVGSIMYPALVERGYPENFSLGLVMTAGALGCLMVPSLILMIYAISVGSTRAAVEAGDMFTAAYVPVLTLALILSLYCFVVGRKVGTRTAFSWRRLGETLREGIWAIALPFIIYFGISRGLFAPSKAGAVAFVYALLVTTVIHRELTLRRILTVLGDAGRLMGMLILIIALAFGLNQLLALIKVEETIAAWVEPLGPVAFMLLVNILLIVIGALMDSISATLVFAPILAPIAMSKGIDPVHFGIVFVVNMEIGYLAPPVATNLFIASALFKKPFGQVSRAVLPGLALTCGGLLMFLFVPTCSKGLLNYTRGEPVYESFPWAGEPITGGVQGGFDMEAASREVTEATAAQREELNALSDDDYYRTPDARAADPIDADPGAPDASAEDLLDEALEGENL